MYEPSSVSPVLMHRFLPLFLPVCFLMSLSQSPSLPGDFEGCPLALIKAPTLEVVLVVKGKEGQRGLMRSFGTGVASPS